MLKLEESSIAQMTAVTGHVYVMYDNDLKPQAKGGLPIVCVSVPGVNLQKSTDDGKYFTNVIPITKQVILKQDTKKELVYRIRRILHHAFLRFQTFGCQVPVLCAIGCGVFASRIAEVPSLYAAAMAHLLSKHNYNFRAVVIPLMTPSDYKDFRNAFKNAPIPHCLVLLMLSRSMIHNADRLARNNICAGILNGTPYLQTDRAPAADNGHIAVEELVALQTTLLLHHRGSNPELYTNEKDRFDRVVIHEEDIQD